MNDLISRSAALRAICFGCDCHSGNETCSIKCGEYIDVESVPTITDEEFKAEAKRRGYRLVKISEKVKTVSLLPCVCGRKMIGRWVNPYNEVFCRCGNCGLEAESAWTDERAKLNWNKMIEEKMKDATD